MLPRFGEGSQGLGSKLSRSLANASNRSSLAPCDYHPSPASLNAAANDYSPCATLSAEPAPGAADSCATHYFATNHAIPYGSSNGPSSNGSTGSTNGTTIQLLHVPGPSVSSCVSIRSSTTSCSNHDQR